MSEEVQSPVEDEISEQVETAEATTADDNQPEAVDSSTTEQPEGDAKAKESKGGFQSRINELTAARYQAEQEAQQLREQLEQLTQKSHQTQHQLEKPTLEQYNYDHEAWSSAMEDWVKSGYESQIRAQQEAQQQYQQQQEQIRRQVELQTKVAKASEKYPDFQAKVFDPNLPSMSQINQAAYEAIVNSEYMADVAYHLASNPAEVYKFQNMSPVEAIREVVKLETRFAKPSTPTTAPPPPSKLSGKGESVTAEPKDIDEWMKWRSDQVNSR